MVQLKQFRKENKITQQHLAEYLMVGQSFISQIEKGQRPMPQEYIAKLQADPAFIRKELLGTDTTNVQNNIANNQTKDYISSANPDLTAISTGKVIPFYDAEAAAGTNYGMEMKPSRPIGMIEIGGLLKDSESALRVYGNSMTPNYPAGCVVGTKLHTDRFIEPGAVYVIETKDNRYLKRVFYNDSKTAFQCISDNHMLYEEGPRKGKPYYPEFDIPFEDVVRLHRVTGVIKRNIL